MEADGLSFLTKNGPTSPTRPQKPVTIPNIIGHDKTIFLDKDFLDALSQVTLVLLQ